MNQKILIVEDNDDICELLKDHLESEGYQITIASDGFCAKPLIESNQFSLYIFDWMLPNTSGVELCRKAKTLNRDIPVIMLTARSDKESIIQGLDAGANDYISKPFDLSELSARIRAQLRSSNKQNKNLQLIKFEKLSIDLQSFEASIDQQKLKLTKSEFLLLVTLISTPNTVFSRKDLIKEIQGDETVVTDRTIDTHMAGLRKKISPYSQQIVTIRGIGYKFEA